MLIDYTPLSESWRMRTNSFLLCDPATIPAFASIFLYFLHYNNTTNYANFATTKGFNFYNKNQKVKDKWKMGCGCEK